MPWYQGRIELFCGKCHSLKNEWHTDLWQLLQGAGKPLLRQRSVQIAVENQAVCLKNLRRNVNEPEVLNTDIVRMMGRKDLING